MEQTKMIPIQRRFVEKPWGAEDWLVQTDNYVAKYLYLNPNEEISLQYHNEKEESMIVLEGMGQLILGDEGFAEIFDKKDSPVFGTTITAGDILTIKPKTIHQIKAYTGMKILEISTPQTEDLVRVSDIYGR
jgi:mannose-6-phosphate isomerase-like protein (cupin superfamily)